MPQYRRFKIEGGIYFFTVVTYQRLPIFTNETCRQLLHQAWVDTCNRYPFETLAVCLLPDHLHCIWKLPEGDADYSSRWREIKGIFSKEYVKSIGPGKERNGSRKNRNEAAIWQRRFWEHTIADEADLETHIDYIHYNPIKHGYVQKAIDWPFSSFAKFVHKGVYDLDWIGGNEGRLSMYPWD
ncbi:MAG: transposase [Anaerolineaceae bacterium]|nr:transposase [Anaerolineaceae bacterium]